MSEEFEKHTISDLGQKLAHVEGILGAYLPSHVFDSELQQKTIDCNKYAFSRLRSGKRKAANWELARFVELFDLARHGFDYRLFLLPFEGFGDALRQAGVGSHGASAAEHLRESLRSRVDVKARIRIHRDRMLNVGGIGGAEEDAGLICLSPRDQVSITVPLNPQASDLRYLLLLHDFPASRAMSYLMPSVFAPEQRVTGQSVRLPQSMSGYLSFPVVGTAGYRCLYGIQSETDLAAYLGLVDPASDVQDVTARQIALLVDLLTHVSAGARQTFHMSFGEYLLK